MGLALAVEVWNARQWSRTVWELARGEPSFSVTQRLGWGEVAPELCLELIWFLSLDPSYDWCPRVHPPLPSRWHWLYLDSLRATP